MNEFYCPVSESKASSPIQALMDVDFQTFTDSGNERRGDSAYVAGFKLEELKQSERLKETICDLSLVVYLGKKEGLTSLSCNARMPRAGVREASQRLL